MPADSMTDQNFHEIQLSGKQLVFVFMSAVVVAVVIFLLGVTVGRGVRNAVPSGTDVSAAPATVPTGSSVPPSGTKQANPGDLTYHDVLQGKTPASGGGNAQPPAPAPLAGTTAPPAAVAAPPAAPPPAQTKSGEPSKGAAADSKAGAKSAPPITAASGWFVQVNIFSTKENAEKQVQQLKAKSFSAFVYTPVGPVTRFHVRIGPFQQRSDAERMAARLVKEGFKPFITP